MTKIRTTRALTLPGAALLLAQPAFAENVDAFVNVVNPMAISSTQSMSFGNIVPGASAGTVTVDTSGTRSASGVVLSSGGTAARAGTVNISGNGSSTFSVTIGGVGGLPVKLTKSDDATKSMTVDTFKVRISTDGTNTEQTSSITGALSAGAAALYIGGKLNVGASGDTPVGDYATNHSGGNPIQVTVSYN